MTDIKRANCVFDTISIEADWWLPDTPTVRVRGRVTGRVAGEFHLSTEGNLGDDFHSHESNMIVLGESLTGQRVTLLQCFSTKRSGSFDRSKADATYFAHWLIVGEHFQKYDELLFDRMYFGISNLEEWHNIKSFDFGFDHKERTASVNYKNPDPVTVLKSDTLVATLEYSYRPSDMRVAQQSAKIEHAARINLQTTSPLPLYDYKEGIAESLFDYASKVASFIEFAIGTKTFLYDISVYSSRYLEPIDTQYKRPIKIYRLLKVPSNTEPVAFHKMLFTWASIQDEPQQYIQAWTDKIQKIGMPVPLYLGSFREQAFQDQRFIELAQGLEGFHRYLYPEASIKSKEHEDKLAQILAGCPEEHQTWLSERLHYSHEPSLRRRLKELFERHKDLVCWFTGSWANVKENIGVIVQNRNQYAHCLDANAEEFTSDSRQRTIRIMQLLFALLLLEECRFSNEQIGDIIRGNWAYSQLQKRLNPKPNLQSQDAACDSPPKT